MRTLLTIILLWSICFAATKKNLKEQLEDCEKQNIELNQVVQKVINANEKVTIEYPCDATRKDVKLAKVEARTDRVISGDSVQIQKLNTELEKWKFKYETELNKSKSKNDLKGLRSTNKHETKTDDTRLWTKLLKSWQLFLGIAIGAGVVLLGKNITKLLPIIKAFF